jgi:hypothetical protein
MRNLINRRKQLKGVGGFAEGAEQALVLMVSPIGYCVRTDEECWYGPDNERLDAGEPERTVTIDRSYIEAQAPSVRNQLLKAGVRLRALLNEALDF